MDKQSDDNIGRKNGRNGKMGKERKPRKIEPYTSHGSIDVLEIANNLKG